MFNLNLSQNQARNCLCMLAHIRLLCVRNNIQQQISDQSGRAFGVEIRGNSHEYCSEFIGTEGARWQRRFTTPFSRVVFDREQT